MDDPELQAIRAQRLAQLRAESGGMTGLSGPASNGKSGNAQDEAEKKSQMEEMRRTMLIQILDNDARERLARIAMVKSDRARSVEDLLIRMARSGQLRGKVNEQQLIGLLEQLNQQSKSESKIVYNRRKEEEDDFDLEL